jgi:hypothetical protein
MDSPARKRLQIPFSEVAVGKKFQMVNSVMKAAIPGSTVFTKTDERRADNGNGGGPYNIRPDWQCEVVES